MLAAQYAVSVYVTVRCPSVRPFVCLPICPVDRQRQRHVTAFFATGARARVAASVNAVIRGGSTQTCLSKLTCDIWPPS